MNERRPDTIRKILVLAAAVLAAAASAAPAQQAQTQPAAAQPQVRQQWFQRAYPPSEASLGSLDPKSGYRFRLELTGVGAAVNDLRLTGYYATVQDKQQARKHADNFEQYLEAVKSDEELKGNYQLLAAVRAGQAAYLPLATAQVVVRPQGMEPYVTSMEAMKWQLLEDQPADGPQQSQTVRFAWTLLRDVNYDRPGEAVDAQPFVRLVKTYVVRKDDNSVLVLLRVENLSTVPVKVTIDQTGPTGVPREDVRADQRRAGIGQLKADGKVEGQLKHDAGELDKLPLGEHKVLGSSDAAEPALWVGFVNKFFGSMMYLQPADASRLSAPAYQAKFYVAAIGSDGGRTYMTGVELPELSVAPGASEEVAFNVFAGPKEREIFSSVPLYKQLNYMSTINLKSCCSIDWLTLGLMAILGFFAKIMLGNYGLAIILLVVLMRLALHPLTKKGQVSMMKMQKLAPKMQELKQKYADDKDTLQREMMKLTREQGAAPIVGCLPMLLQLPIWVALWTGLSAEVALRQAAFLPVWLNDLAAPDALVSWASHPLSIPLLSGIMGPIISFNLLPLLLTAAMYFQTKLNPTAAPTSPEQASQQKIMKVMMPGMMLLFFYNAPSGLTLYIMTSTASGVIEQMVIRRHIRQRETAEAAAETKVAVPGKGPRGSRPKKPKGPLWFKRG